MIRHDYEFPEEDLYSQIYNLLQGGLYINTLIANQDLKNLIEIFQERQI